VGSLPGCGGGGHEAHSEPSTPIGIKYKWKAVGMQVNVNIEDYFGIYRA